MGDWLDERERRQPLDGRDWNEYPIGTLAHAVTGGHWLKTARGWQWNGRHSTFPTPGGDACSVTLPDVADDLGEQDGQAYVPEGY